MWLKSINYFVGQIIVVAKKLFDATTNELTPTMQNLNMKYEPNKKSSSSLKSFSMIIC